MHQILASGPYDYLCREYTARLLDNGKTARDVPCFVAMEGVGLARALKDRSRPVPFAIVRGGANYDVYPMYRQQRYDPHSASSGAGGAVAAGDMWYQNTTFISVEAHEAMTKQGYQYAIRVANTIILRFVQKAPSMRHRG